MTFLKPNEVRDLGRRIEMKRMYVKVVFSYNKSIKVSKGIVSNNSLCNSIYLFRWYLKFKCANCGEIPDHFQYISRLDKHPLKVYLPGVAKP